jgi:translocation protein SEC62
MLFNLWPLWLKIGIWYFSFYTLMFLLGLILVRLSIWLFLFHFGVDFWIFPNLFSDNLGPIESFFPLYQFEKRGDDMKMVGVRILSAISLVFLVYLFSKEPENLEGLSSFTNDSMNDLFNWGNDRFVLGRIEDKSGVNGTAKRKKTPQQIFMEAILEEEEPPKQEEPPKEEEPTSLDDDNDSTIDEPVFDRDAIGDDDDKEEKGGEL